MSDDCAIIFEPMQVFCDLCHTPAVRYCCGRDYEICACEAHYVRLHEILGLWSRCNPA